MSQHLTAVQRQLADAGYSVAEEFSPRQLQEAYGTIFALKMKLEAATRELARVCQDPTSPASAAVQPTNKSLIDTAIKDRARRSSIFPAGLFADPAWDMMLELHRAEVCQYRVSVSNLCLASRGPVSTALRWISTLQSEGLAARDADPFDGRRFYIRLTEDGSMAMKRYLSGGPAVEAVQ